MQTDEELESDRLTAIENFRRERLEEPLEDYLELFDRYQGYVEDVLEATVDLVALRELLVRIPAPESAGEAKEPDPMALSALNAAVADILRNSEHVEVFRYLAGPPISVDDLKIVADARSLVPGSLSQDTDLPRRLTDVILTGLDRRRFPWMSEGREPTEAERSAAVLASAALLAMRRLETSRRSTGRNQQEQRVEDALIAGGLRKVTPRRVDVLKQAPGRWEFCRETELGGRKADFLVGLGDDRVLAIECKVSNSATNSVKRLNNDAAAKAQHWIKDFGLRQVVPAAILAGVFKLHNLADAQARGLSIFWEHRLTSLTDWIQSTR